MPGWRIKTASFLFLAIATCLPAQAQAQASWGVRLFADGGWMFHTRKMAKNAVTIQEQASNQVVAEIDDSPVVGGVIEITLPGPSMHIRANLRTTVGATAQSFLSVCGGEVSPAGAGLCAAGDEVDASIVEGSVDLVFLSETSSRLLQPTLWFGFGVRSYDFDTDLPPCAFSNIDEQAICVSGREIFENPSTNALLNVGLGMTTRPGPVSGFLQGRVVLTSYTGGVGLADGEKMMDVLIQGGVSVRVR